MLSSAESVLSDEVAQFTLPSTKMISIQEAYQVDVSSVQIQVTLAISVEGETWVIRAPGFN